MTEQQIPKLAGSIVEHQEHFVNLSNQDGQWVIQNTVEAISLFVTAVKNRAEQTVSKLLEFITTIQVPGIKRFTAADHFKEGETVDGVKIAWLGGNFKTLFLQKVENDVPAAVVKVSQLTRNSKDLGIRTEIGEANEEIALAHLWQVLKSHGNGKVGDWIVGYIYGTDGNLWAVLAHWGSRGWDLEASSVGSPDGWCAGGQILSR